MKGAAFQRRFVMEQTHCPTSENMPQGRLVADALSEITRLEITEPVSRNLGTPHRFFPLEGIGR